MSDYRQHTPQYPGGQYGDKPYEPPPPTPTCPDPCDTKPRWGPPEIREGCCDPNPCCKETHCCTWDSVEDPCVKAASADCTDNWAKIECKCQSDNEKCCEEWGCGGYPEGVCVPCEPCKDLLPEPPDDDGGGGCDDNDVDCTSGDLSKQLDNLTKCISFQQGEMARLDAEIKARVAREKELRTLIDTFDKDVLGKYETERPKLICREDCLKGFHRDISALFSKYDQGYLDKLKKAINDFLCKLEMAKCCQKNLEYKLTKVTQLIAAKEKADKDLAKAETAFATVTDLPTFIGNRFKELETLKDEIAKALTEKNPESLKWAFYLFYWKFVPLLCGCFPYPFCCEEKPTGYEGGSEKPQQSQQYSQQGQQPQPSEEAPTYLGCAPGDWHPSKIKPEFLKTLVCCAWDYARKRKQDAQEKTEAVETARRNLELIKKNVEDAAKPANFEKNLKNAIKPVEK